MSSLLDAANSSTDKFILDGTLPRHVGEVSIMSIKNLAYLLKKDSIGAFNRISADDPTKGYDSSTYYVYGIVGSIALGEIFLEDGDKDSIIKNLQSVGLQWYRQLNRPTTESQTWEQAGHRVVGGPLYCVDYDSIVDACFFFMYSSNAGDLSSTGYDDIKDTGRPAYVAVVCAHESPQFISEPYVQEVNMTSELPTKISDVSIMTIKELFDALENSNPRNNIKYHFDPTAEFLGSKYHIYGIAGDFGRNSTAENLKKIFPNHSPLDIDGVFGGPLTIVNVDGNDCIFQYDSGKEYGLRYSSDRDCWNSRVDYTVYVAVVCVAVVANAKE